MPEFVQADYFLDITGEVCPMTFVRTKLLLEKIEPGAVLQVRLRGEEPLQNVPRSVEEMGHAVLELRLETSQTEEDIHLLYVKKAGDRVTTA
jgi:TusA-related sulfurtransferase